MSRYMRFGASERLSALKRRNPAKIRVFGGWKELSGFFSALRGLEKKTRTERPEFDPGWKKSSQNRPKAGPKKPDISTPISKIGYWPRHLLSGVLKGPGRGLGRSEGEREEGLIAGPERPKRAVAGAGHMGRSIGARATGYRRGHEARAAAGSRRCQVPGPAVATSCT